VTRKKLYTQEMMRPKLHLIDIFIHAFSIHAFSIHASYQLYPCLSYTSHLDNPGYRKPGVKPVASRESSRLQAGYRLQAGCRSDFLKMIVKYRLLYYNFPKSVCKAVYHWYGGKNYVMNHNKSWEEQSYGK
jgi:hypothetical protein